MRTYIAAFRLTDAQYVILRRIMERRMLDPRYTRETAEEVLQELAEANATHMLVEEEGRLEREETIRRALQAEEEE